MKAAVLHGREDVRVEEVGIPALEPGDVLLRTRAALTCGTDVKVWKRGYHARMLQPPALFGHELAGVVEEVRPARPPGAERRDSRPDPPLKPGERVVVANSAPCGVCGFCRDDRESLCDDLVFWNGAYAEFARIPARIAERNVLRLEPGTSFRDAALAEPLACVVRGIEASRVREGSCVVVIGAGPIGLMLVRLARLRGARVVAVGRNRGRLESALALGASETIDATSVADLGERLAASGPEGSRPDVVIEAAGLAETAQAAIHAVRKGGLVNLFAGCPREARVVLDAQRLHYEELTVTSTFHHTPRSFREALQLITGGEVRADAFVTAEAPLDAVPDVLRRMAEGGDGLKTAILPWGPG
jgi:L-iditol 2-dehydrogenase